MTILIKMRGEFDKIAVEGDETTFLNKMNVASAQGMEFVLMEKAGSSGRMIGVSTHNMLTFEEADDDSDLLV
jgi:hypothetical protein